MSICLNVNTSSLSLTLSAVSRSVPVCSSSLWGKNYNVLCIDYPYKYLILTADELWESMWFINNLSSKTTTCCAVADILNSWLVFQTNIRHLLSILWHCIYCFTKIVNVTVRSSRTSTELDCLHLAIIISDEHQETPQLHPNHVFCFQVRLKLLSLHVHV